MKTIKKIKILLLLLVFTSVSGYGQFSGGNGTAESPYEIRTKQELENVALFPNSHFVLKANIRDSVRTPIEKIENSILDGNGYKITLAIKNNYIAALFQFAVGDIKIKNLVVDGYVHGNWAAGILGDIHNNYPKVNSFKIINSVNMAKITGHCASGFIHELRETKAFVDKSINLGTCKTYNNALSAGIISHHSLWNLENNIIISNTINAGFIQGYEYASGFLGYEFYGDFPNYLEDVTNILNSINTGIIKSGTNYFNPFLLKRKR